MRKQIETPSAYLWRIITEHNAWHKNPANDKKECQHSDCVWARQLEKWYPDNRGSSFERSRG